MKIEDNCTAKGARKLEGIIQQYWAARGYAVECSFVECEFTQAMRSTRTDLRSDMKNGFPVRRI